MSAKRVASLLVILLFAIHAQAFAISDTEYKSMLTDPVFKKSEDQLNQTWKMLKSKMTVDNFEKLKRDQNDWIKQRDSSVEKLLGSVAPSNIPTLYAQENLKRVDYLQKTYLSQDGTPAASPPPVAAPESTLQQESKASDPQKQVETQQRAGSQPPQAFPIADIELEKIYARHNKKFLTLFRK